MFSALPAAACAYTGYLAVHNVSAHACDRKKWLITISTDWKMRSLHMHRFNLKIIIYGVYNHVRTVHAENKWRIATGLPRILYTAGEQRYNTVHHVFNWTTAIICTCILHGSCSNTLIFFFVPLRHNYTIRRSGSCTKDREHRSGPGHNPLSYFWIIKGIILFS